MKNDLIQSIVDLFQRLKPLVAMQFVRPLKEIERASFPPGYNNVMCIIKSKDEGPVSMTDLAMAANIAKPNLTTIVDRLLSEGLVERSNVANDRRIVNIVLTQQGEDFLDARRKGLASFIENRFSTLDEQDLKKLKCALEDITEILEKMNK